MTLISWTKDWSLLLWNNMGGAPAVSKGSFNIAHNSLSDKGWRRVQVPRHMSQQGRHTSHTWPGRRPSPLRPGLLRTSSPLTRCPPQGWQHEWQTLGQQVCLAGVCWIARAKAGHDDKVTSKSTSKTLQITRKFLKISASPKASDKRAFTLIG